jgi:DNA-binding HxlR family transcriptional regulator
MMKFTCPKCGFTANIVSVRSERTRALILSTLFEEGRALRWTELLELTKLSPRTLSLRLNDLEEEEAVTRRVSTEGGKYPPPVTYEITQVGRVQVQAES